MLASACWRLVAVVFLSLAASHAKAQYHTLTTFEVPGSYSMGLWDINNHGQIVGWASFGAEETGFTNQSFLLDAKTLAVTPFTGPAGTLGAMLTGISDDGVLVGSYAASSIMDPVSGVPVPVEKAFVYDGASFETLVVPGAVTATARGISPDGRYVSGRYSTEDIGGFFVYDRLVASYTLAQGQQMIVNGANSSGLLVGTELRFTQDSLERVPFIYSIAGNSFSDYSRGSFGETVSPRAISDQGVIAGWFAENGASYGFVDDGTWVEVIALDGSNETYVQGINNAGWIVGSAVVDGKTVGIIGAPPVPEPSTYALFGLGVGLLGWQVRNSRRRRGAA